MSKKKKLTKSTFSSQSIIYIIAIVVIIVPLLLLGVVYFSTKENAGSPTFGDRFETSLDPAIERTQLKEIEKALVYNDVENVEVNLKSATLRITLDTKDNVGSDRITAILKDAYKKVDAILPVKTYFMNQENKKMYDLDIHAYNFLAEEDNTKGWVYKELIKNAAAKSSKIDTLSAPRDKETSDTLLQQQEALKQQEGQ
ncbi:MAG: hypothetical protein UIM26_00695 [Longicatena sp.]|nr:hypothetical protein [Longicatena sp.]